MMDCSAVARLTLNRPHLGNAIDLPLAKALTEALVACDEDDGIRCVVLAGAGRMFCAGGDISGFKPAGDGVPGLVKELTSRLIAASGRDTERREGITAFLAKHKPNFTI